MGVVPSSRHGAGQKRGRYRLIHRLGSGGMAEVWAARNEITGADVALKVLAGDPGNETAARFRHEARISSKLSHRSVVRIFDLVEDDDGTLLLVMERLRGDTLGKRIASRGPLSTREGLAVIVPILSALAHAHDQGIIHRDVTPENVFLAVDPDGYVIPKLLDFGIAKVPDSGVRTVDGHALGTPRYMAPEQIRDPASVEPRSDLFSVGVVLYEALTGDSPFAASTSAGSLAAVLERVVDPHPTLNPSLWAELRRALAKRPYERHRNAREMAAAMLSSTGLREADLSEALRAEKASAAASIDALEGAAPSAAGGADALDPPERLGDSQPLADGDARANAKRNAARRRWLVFGALGTALLVACLLAAATLRKRAVAGNGPAASAHAREPSERTPPGAVDRPPPSSVAEPPQNAPASADAAAVDLASEHTLDASVPAGNVPARRRHPKPVGTSPGF